jgi:NitT/TauT family transport system substrate-binding protein
MQRGCGGLIALLVLVVVGCTPAQQPPLVVGTVPWVGTEPLFLASELGLYPASEIHLAEYMNTPQRLQAFRNGVIDAVTLTLDDVLGLEQFGQRLRVVLVLDASHGADCLVARPEVKTLADLKGLRVASEDMLLPTYMLHRALEQVGLRDEDVQRSFHNPDEQEAVFQRGEAEAVVSYEPYCQRLRAVGAHTLFDSARIPGEIIDVLVVRESYLQAHPERVDLLLRGWFAALAHFQAHPSEDAARMAPRLGLEAAEVLESMKGVRYPDPREQRTLLGGSPPRLQETMERLAAVMLEQQLLVAPPDTRRLIDTQPLLRVAP